MMDETRFWSIIDSSRRKATEQKRGKNEDFLAAHERTLADVVDKPDAPYMQSEGFQYVALNTYQRVTGADSWPETEPRPYPAPELEGERFDFDGDDEMMRRFPRIVTKFPEGFD